VGRRCCAGQPRARRRRHALAWGGRRRRVPTPVLASPSTPFPFLLGPWQSVTASPLADVNTCFLDRTSAAAKRVESSGEEEQEQGDGYARHGGAHTRRGPRRPSVRGTTCGAQRRAWTMLPAQMSSSVFDSTSPTRVVVDSTAPSCPARGGGCCALPQVGCLAQVCFIVGDRYYSTAQKKYCT
jgi:hypothetical protein